MAGIFKSRSATPSASSVSEEQHSFDRSPRSIGRATRAGVMWAYVRTMLSATVALPTSMILARLLSPSDFGIAAAATFFGQLAARLSNAGLGNALVRMKDIREDHVSSVVTLNLALALTFIVGLVAGAPFIAGFYRAPEIARVMPIVAFDFLLGALAMISQTLLTRAMRYREMATLGSASTIVQALSTVVFAWAGFKYWSLVLGNVCGSAVVWLGGVRYVGWHLRVKFVPSAARELISFALGSYSKGMLEYFSQNFDDVVIGRVLGITALGFYDKAFSSVNQAYRRLTVVGPSVSFRALAAMQDDPERFHRAFDKIIITSTFVAYGVFAVLGAAGPRLIVTLFGEKWRPSIIPFQLLAFAGALKISIAYGGAAASARGWVWSNVWRQATQLFCIIAGVYLASTWGINGASAAVLGATMLMFVLTQSLLHSATGCRWRDLLAPHLPGVALGVGTGALIWGIDAAFRRGGGHFASQMVLAVQLSAAGLFGCAFTWWCPFREVRIVIVEIVDDVSPPVARWLRRHYYDDTIAKPNKKALVVQDVDRVNI